MAAVRFLAVLMGVSFLLWGLGALQKTEWHWSTIGVFLLFWFSAIFFLAAIFIRDD